MKKIDEIGQEEFEHKVSNPDFNLITLDCESPIDSKENKEILKHKQVGQRKVKVEQLIRGGTW